jgi:PAS domain S-box-containing protein
MNIEHILRQIRAFRDRLEGREATGEGEAAPYGRDMPPEEALEALNVAMEQLRVAEEELRRQNHELTTAHWALEEERRLYHDLFEHSPDAYLVTDLAGVIRDANQAATALLNVDKRFLVGKPLANFVVEGGRTAFRLEVNRLAQAPGTSQFDLVLKPRKGPPIDAEVSVRAEIDPHGAAIRLRWSLRDVTWRRRVEEQFRDLSATLERRVVERTVELEAELHAKERLLIEGYAAAEAANGSGQPMLELVQELDAIIWKVDAATGRFTFVSRGAEAILGYPASRWFDDPRFWVQRLHPDDREWAVKNRERKLLDGLDHEAEYRMLAADGRPVWFRESVRIFKDAEGRPRELRGLMVNISRRKKVERQFYAERSEMAARLEDMTYLQELSGRLSGTLELQPILEEILMGVMAVQGAEKGVLKLLDRERNELRLAVFIGLPPTVAQFLDRVPVVPGSGSCSRVVTEGGPLIIEDAKTDAADDHDREVARLGGFCGIYTTPLLNRRGEILGTIATYFDECHRPSERQVRLVELFARQAGDFIENARLYREVREASRTREAFLAMLGHELRNPLDSIVVAAKHLKTAGGLDPDGAESLAVIDRQARHLASLVGELMDASRISRGKVELRKSMVDLGDVVSRAVAAARPAIEARGHDLSVSLPEAPCLLEADADRLVQVLVNLLTNAAKFTDPGGRIALAASAEGGWVTIRVRDTGVGIAPEAMASIFDMFAQAGLPHRTSPGGLGIGLWLSRNLVELHGGRLTASSAGPGQGSTFVVSLPSHIAHPPPTSPTESETATLRPN